GPAQVIHLVTVSHLLLFLRFVLGKVHSKGQVLFSNELLEFGERLLTEVPELHHIGYFELHQVAECFHIGSLKTVVGPNRKVKVVQWRLEKLAHVQHFLINLLDFSILPGFEFDRLVGEQAEVLDQNMCRTFECLLRMDRTIRLYVDQQLFVVGLLLHPGIFYAKLNVLDGCEDGVDRNKTEDLFARFVFLSGKVSPSLIDGKFDFKVGRLIKIADYVIRVEDLECRSEPGDVAREKLLLLLDRNCDLVVEAFRDLFEPDHFQVQDNFSDIFHHTFDRREFMKNSRDLNA